MKKKYPHSWSYLAIFLTVNFSVISCEAKQVSQNKELSNKNNLNENGIFNMKFGMSLANARNILKEKFRIDNSEDPSKICSVVRSSEQDNVNYVFFHDRLVRIDVSAGLINKINLYGIYVGSKNSLAIKSMRERNFTIRHFSEDADFFVYRRMKSPIAFKIFVESGRVSWISAGTDTGLKLDEGCV